jgi:hypothetical protein
MLLGFDSHKLGMFNRSKGKHCFHLFEPSAIGVGGFKTISTNSV